MPIAAASVRRRLCDRGCSMEKQKHKKRWLSIRGKLLNSYLSMVFIILLLGVLGVNSIYRVYSNGSTIYYNHMRAVEYLKSVSQNLREIDRDLVVLCTGAGMYEDSEYLFSIMTLQNENDRLLHAYEKLALTEMEKRRYEQCRLSLRAFRRQTNAIVDLIQHDKSQTVYAVYEQELTPIKAVSFELIDATVELSLRKAEERNIANQSIFTEIIIAACVLCLCGVGAAVAIAFFMSNYFTRRFDCIRDLARRMGEYDISDDLKELPEDELGETMRALNDSQFMIRDFMGNIVSETEEMTDMGADVSRAVRKVRDRLQKESVILAENGDQAEELSALAKAAMTEDLDIAQRRIIYRKYTELAYDVRQRVDGTCSDLAEMTTYLEQIAVTSDQQNEILNTHRDKISRFKTGET